LFTILSKLTMEPKSGFTPHGTPESSLAVTTTSGSSELGVPQPQNPIRAMPAVPALPAREREKSDRSRQSSSSSTSSNRTTSTVLLRRAEHRRLLAALEIAQAKHALAEAEEEQLLETVTRKSGSHKSRSTRGVRSSGVESVLSRKVTREKDIDIDTMLTDSIDRFRAAEVPTELMAPVLEDVAYYHDVSGDARRLHSAQCSSPSGYAYSSAQAPDFAIVWKSREESRDFLVVWKVLNPHRLLS
jgi:hypothetical protein